MAAESRRGVYAKIDLKLLVERVRNYPYLYNKKEIEFKNQVKKTATWNKIGATFGISGSLAIAKWKSLRRKYLEEYQKLCDAEHQRSRPTKEPHVKWKLFDILHPMMQNGHYVPKPLSISNIEHRASIVNIKQEHEVHSLDESDVVLQPEVQLDTGSPINAYSFTDQSSSHTTDEPASSSFAESTIPIMQHSYTLTEQEDNPGLSFALLPPGKKQKLDQAEEYLKSISESFDNIATTRVPSTNQGVPSTSDHYHFAMDLLHRLDKLTPQRVCQFKRNVALLLSDLELEQLQEEDTT